MRIFAVVGKGGAGKTTTTVNLAAGLALRGNRVLVVDMDAQLQASACLTRDFGQGPSFADVLVRRAGLEETVVETAGLELAPGADELAELSWETIGEDAVRSVLEPHRDRWDWGLIDTPAHPGGFAVWTALCAADEVVVPIKAEFLAYHGVSRYLRVIDQAKRSCNDRVILRGFVVNQFLHQPRMTGMILERMENMILERMEESFGAATLLKPYVRQDIRLAYAAARRTPVQLAFPDSNGAKDFNALAEVIDHDRRDGSVD